MRVIRWGVLLLLLSGILFAQQANVGGIAGTVRDPARAVVSGAQVLAVTEGTTAKQETHLYGVADRQLHRHRDASGFVTAELNGVPVISGQSFTVDFLLLVGRVTETVSVTGAAPAVDRTTVNMGTTGTEQEYEL